MKMINNSMHEETNANDADKDEANESSEFVEVD